MSKRLEGKVALITGTGSGIGRASALRFADEGALVVGCDINEQGNRETVEAAQTAGGTMTGMAPVDLGDPDRAAAWVEEAVGVHGRVDVLFNNAGNARFGPITEFSVEDWQFTIRNELDQVFYVTKSAWPHLADGGGVIINSASIAAHTGTKGVGTAAHNATKGGVLALTRGLAAEGGPHGIRAVSISPGLIKTPASIRDYLHIPGMEEMAIEQLLVDRLGLPEDIAAMAAYIASDDAVFLTGVDLLVDGGHTAV